MKIGRRFPKRARAQSEIEPKNDNEEILSFKNVNDFLLELEEILEEGYLSK